MALCLNAEVLSSQEEGPIRSPSPPGPTYSLSFEEFKLQYRKSYNSLLEEGYRRLVFKQNMDECNRHNSDPLRLYDVKPNSFMDLTDD